ncbi:MAG TPA: hypothetical protein VKU19_18840 [Bryobacteraceae bacterium]|nr:hypothetical protein [Bryobacteraceae bacterium]
MNAATVAIELHLKCLSADVVYTDAGGDWSKITSTPSVRCHVLTKLLDRIDENLRDGLNCAFREVAASLADRLEQSALAGISFREALKQCEGAFEASRYPFEKKHDLTKYELELLMECSRFLYQFVMHLQPRETIHD